MPSWIAAQDVSIYSLCLTPSSFHLQLCFLWIPALLGEAESAIFPSCPQHSVPTQVAPRDLTPPPPSRELQLMRLCGSLQAGLGAHDRGPGVGDMRKGSCLTVKTMITSVSRMQRTKQSPQSLDIHQIGKRDTGWVFLSSTENCWLPL